MGWNVQDELPTRRDNRQLAQKIRHLPRAKKPVDSDNDFQYYLVERTAPTAGLSLPEGLRSHRA
jgi:hypothetical protein